MRKAFGAGMFVSPHKLAVDKEGSPGPIPFFPHGYGYNLGAQRGIRIGSAKDGSVKYFIPDSCPYPYAGGSSLAEGVTADSDGNVYGVTSGLNFTQNHRFEYPGWRDRQARTRATFTGPWK